MNDHMTVRTVIPEMRGVKPLVRVPAGGTVEEMAHYLFEGDLDGVQAWVRAPAGSSVQWIDLDPSMWHRVRPKVDDCLMFSHRPGKSALRGIFAIVIAVVTAVVAPYLAATLGTVLGSLATAGIGIAGSLLINALFPVSTSSSSSSSDQDSDNFSAVTTDSNVLAKEAYLPSVAGIRRIKPPELTYPYLRMENGQQTIRRIFGLHGHHQISDIWVDGTPVSDFSRIETQIRDGAETSKTTTSLLSVVNNTDNLSETLSTFDVDDKTIVDQFDPGNSEPVWSRFSTITDDKMEEIIIRLQVSGFLKTDSASEKVRVPLRLRFRAKGTNNDWFKIPEIHLTGRDVSTKVIEIRVRWDGNFGSADSGGTVQSQFFRQVPAAGKTLSDGNADVQWEADNYFWSDGSRITDTANIVSRRDAVHVTLDRDAYPKQAYEWEIMRGLAMKKESLNTSSYAISGTVYSLFSSYWDASSATWLIPVDQGAYTVSMTAAQATTVVDRQPCSRPGTAIVGLKSTGQSVKSVTLQAARYVSDWDGEGWNARKITKNPATHARQLLHDWLTYNDVDTGLINNDEFVAWREECEAKGYEVSLSMSGDSVSTYLGQIMTAGFARPRFSDGFGVDFFRDRSDEMPVQNFSPRNATISIGLSFSAEPAGIRASFQNEALDYDDDEIQVPNPLYNGRPRYDVVSYDSIANPHLVMRRATFDMLQSYYQGRRAISVETAIEGLICERGDLVSICSDLLNDMSWGARVRAVLSPTTIAVDQLVPPESTTSIFEIDDVFDPANLFAVGEQTLAFLTTPVGPVMLDVEAIEVQASRTVIRLAGKICADGERWDLDLINGTHVSFGAASQFTKRYIVSEVERSNQEMATLTCLDEAPEIFEKMKEWFG